MLSDTDLTRTRVALPQEDALRVKRELSPFKRTVLFCLLLIANVTVWALAYNLWTGKDPRIWKLLPLRRTMVRGILYSDENPCAIVRDEVVQEGDTIKGYKVVKIYRHKVELEKDGKILTKQVQ